MGIPSLSGFVRDMAYEVLRYPSSLPQVERDNEDSPSGAKWMNCSPGRSKPVSQQPTLVAEMHRAVRGGLIRLSNFLNMFELYLPFDA